MEKKNVFEEIVTFSKEEWDVAIDNAYEKVKKDIKMDGFREGKVPKDVFYKKAGKESLYRDALDILFIEAYKRALENKDYKPIIEPGVEIVKMDSEGLTLKFIITTRPEVKIKKYTGLNIKKKDDSVTDEEVAAEIKKMLEEYSELALKDGEVAVGDVAYIDFEGFLNGVAFDGGKGENYPLEIGSNTFIPGFEEQLVGMTKDLEKEIEVTFPEDYQSEELKGKKATFKVKVNEIKERIERTLDEEFFEDLGMEGVDSKEALEKEVRANLEANKKDEIENALVDELLKEIAKNTEVEIPEEVIHEEIHNMMHQFEEQLRHQGASLDLYYTITKTTAEDLEKQMEPEAKNHVLYRFIVEEIKEKENIKIEDSKVEDFIKDKMEKYNMDEAGIIDIYGSKEGVRYELEVREVFNFLKEKNVK